MSAGRRQSSFDLPAIAPAGSDPARPLWSVMIPVYNCADLLVRTLESVLAQDPGPEVMQIEVVDDVSTSDDPEATVRRIGGGRVGFHRRSRNGGHVANFNTCVARARGRLVHILHGDDWVKPGFYEAIGAGFAASPDIGAAFCRSIYCTADGEETGTTDPERDRAGVLDDWVGRLLDRQRLCTPSIVVRRDVYEHLGGFDPRFTTAGEDWEMWTRIAAHYPVWFDPAPLACYRMTRAGSLTGAAHRTTRVADDMRRACDILQKRVGPVAGEAFTRRRLSGARRFYAGWSLEYARQVLPDVGFREVRPHLLAALRFCPNPWMAAHIARLVFEGRQRS